MIEKVRPNASAGERVEDPHPSNEEHYNRERRPGGANPPKKDLGPNPHIHTGKPGSQVGSRRPERRG
jgi:hypothetical protein